MHADGKYELSATLTKTAGSFGCVAAIAGFYLLAQGLCLESLPLGRTTGLLQRLCPMRQKTDETSIV